MMTRPPRMKLFEEELFQCQEKEGVRMTPKPPFSNTRQKPILAFIFVFASSAQT